MSNQSPRFLLKVANAFVDEVARDADRVVETGSEVDQSLERAKRLADAAAQADSQISLDNGTTPMVVKARAFFQQGHIDMRLGHFEKAVKNFEESLNQAVDQATFFNMGLCFLAMKGLFRDRTQDAVAAFQKCIELDPEAEIAIEAGKELARLGEL